MVIVNITTIVITIRPIVVTVAITVTIAKTTSSKNNCKIGMRNNEYTYYCFTINTYVNSCTNHGIATIIVITRTMLISTMIIV